MHVQLKGVLKIFNCRLQTYEHEAMWGKALVTYDLETTIASSTRHAGIIQVCAISTLVKHYLCSAKIISVCQWSLYTAR